MTIFHCDLHPPIMAHFGYGSGPYFLSDGSGYGDGVDAGNGMGCRIDGDVNTTFDGDGEGHDLPLSN